MAQCGKRRGGCNTPESLARARAEAQKAHDKWVREYIAKQKLASIVPKSIRGKADGLGVLGGITALVFVVYMVRLSSKS